VAIACNGLSALKKAKANYPTEPGEAHHDLINAIQHLQGQLPINLIFKHVKGHQDQGLITALPRLAWMTIKMDSYAKSKLLSADANTQQDTIPFEGWM